MSDSLQTFGLYVTPDIIDYVDDVLYDACGIVDVREYYGEQGKVRAGDPLAEVFDVVLDDILADFAVLYREANFDVDVKYDEFELLTVAGSGENVYEFRDKVEAVRVLEECDTRTVHTAIMATAIDMGYFEGVSDRDDIPSEC